MDLPHLARLTLADPQFLKPQAIDVIIGADAYGQVMKPNIIKGTGSVPVGQLSIFGWLVLGPVHSPHSSLCSAYHVQHQTDTTHLQDLLTKFWVQEKLPSDSTCALTKDEQECEEHFKSTHSRDSDGRYIVRLPLKSSSRLLGNSHPAAHQCLMRTLKKLHHDETYKQLYFSFMAEYEQLGHMVQLSGNLSNSKQAGAFASIETADEMTLAPGASKPPGGLRVSSGGSHGGMQPDPVYYLPHHGVLRPESQTTKLRVVLNGSCSTSTGHSLNDLMHTGANLLLDITDVLIWIRHHRHIFATDITKMYRQIKVHKDDWDLKRLLWVDSELKETQFQLTMVTYGTRSAPFLAVRVLLQLVQDEGHRFPLPVPLLLKGRYVDDIFGGADTVEQLNEIAQELTNLCKAGGFPLAKWKSTHSELLTTVSPSKENSPAISFDDCSTKLLGLKWLPQSDCFTFSTTLTENSTKITKRLILSEVAQIFDPLGFISPVTIRAKVLLQELWLHKINWDDSLPPDIISRWSLIKEDLQSLDKLSIPRWFNTWSNSTVEIHGFSDASQLAMSAVIYIVVNSPSTGAKSTIVCAKTRVAPLKQLTIPRLELTAALLLSKLLRRTQASLTLPISATYLWTDSQVTLTWINSPASRWKDYVRNRVTLIQQLTEQCQWRHVPGTQNPADAPSRGLTAHQINDHPLRWTGPPWMTKQSSSWPRQPHSKDDISALEARPGVALLVATPSTEYHWNLILNYSSLEKTHTNHGN